MSQPSHASEKSAIPVLTDIVKSGNIPIPPSEPTATTAPKTTEELEKIIAAAIREKMQVYIDTISSDIAAAVILEIKHYLEQDNTHKT